MKKIGLFAAGVLFDTAGLKILGCREAKKVYTGVTAAALRAKDCMMDAVTTVRENARISTRTPRSRMSAGRPSWRRKWWRTPC